MKKIVFLTAALGLTLGISSAQALECFSNSYATGCSGGLGAWAITRDGAVAVDRAGNINAYRRDHGFYAYRRGDSCYWHNGQQLCR